MQVVRGIEAAGSFPIRRSARTGKIATVAVYAPANKVATPSWHPAQTSSRLHNLQEKSLMQAFCFRNPVRFRNPISAIPLNLSSDIIDVIAENGANPKIIPSR